MPKSLTLLVCSYLMGEVRAALEAEGLKDVEIATFTGDCDGLGKQPDIAEHVPDADLKILGGACHRILKSNPNLPKGSRVHPQSICFEMLLGQQTTEQLVRDGAHLLVPSMVRDWRTVSKGWGFDTQTAKAFFEESGRHLVLLDTGIGASCADDLRAFSEFAGLEVEVRPVTLDYIRILLRQIYDAWKLEKSDTEKARAHRRIADLTLADELIKNLASEDDEGKIIDGAIELFSVLCAPRSVNYQAFNSDDKNESDEPARHNKNPMSQSMRTALEGNVEPLKWIDQCDGFFVQVRHLDHILGIMTVEGVAVPAHARDYLELAKTVTPILALAVHNARTHKRLAQVEPDLLRYQNELEHMVEDRTAKLTQEIAEKERAEAELQDLEHMYEDLYNNAPDMFVSVDAKTKAILQCNDTLANNLGYAQKDLIGKPITFVYHPDCMDEVEKAFHSFITTGEVHNAELQLKRKDGRKIYVILNVSAVRDEDGNILHSRSVWRDITDRKKIEYALAVAKEEAEQANNAKSDFLAAMSHDLRTPLNAIIGFSEMMRIQAFGALGDPHYEHYANDIFNSGTLLISLINDILDLSKIESGKYELTEERLNISSVIETSFQQLEQAAETSEISLSAHVPDDIPPLLGDERALIQVFNNLLSNAIKFTPKHGAIDVTAYVDESNRIIIAFTDTGIGMDAKSVVKALKPFEQADGLHSKRHEGTGLGLFLCGNLMKLFGGTLDIESEVNKGTVVTLRFPQERTMQS